MSDWNSGGLPQQNITQGNVYTENTPQSQTQNSFDEQMTDETTRNPDFERNPNHRSNQNQNDLEDSGQSQNGQNQRSPDRSKKDSQVTEGNPASHLPTFNSNTNYHNNSTIMEQYQQQPNNNNLSTSTNSHRVVTLVNTEEEEKQSSPRNNSQKKRNYEYDQSPQKNTPAQSQNIVWENEDKTNQVFQTIGVPDAKKTKVSSQNKNSENMKHSDNRNQSKAYNDAAKNKSKIQDNKDFIEYLQNLSPYEQAYDLNSKSEDYIDFYIFHDQIAKQGSCSLNFKNINSSGKRKLKMDIIGETNVAYLRVYFPVQTLQYENKITYTYIIHCYTDYESQEINRYKTINRVYLKSYFDTPLKLQNIVYKELKTNSIDPLLQFQHFFLNSWQDINNPWANSNIWNELIVFYKDCRFSFHHEEMFKNLQKFISDENYLKRKIYYCVVLIKSLSNYVREKKELIKKAYYDFLNYLCFNRMGMLKMVFKELKSYGNINELQDYILGLREIIYARPLIALQFVGEYEIIEDLDKTIETINLIDQTERLNDYKRTLEHVLSSNKIEEKGRNALIKKYLDCGRDLDFFLDFYQSFKNQTDLSIVFKYFARIKSNNSSYKNRDFIKYKLDSILQDENLSNIFSQEIYDIIIDLCKNNYQKSSVILNQHQQLLKPNLIKDISQNQNKIIQEQLKSQLIFASLQRYSQDYKPADLNEILDNIIQRSLLNQQSLLQISETLQQLLEYVQDPRFNTVKDYMSKSLFKRIQNHLNETVKKMVYRGILSEIRQVFNKCEDYLTKDILSNSILNLIEAKFKDLQPKDHLTLLETLFYNNSLISKNLQNIYDFLIRQQEKLFKNNLSIQDVFQSEVLKRILRYIGLKQTSDKFLKNIQDICQVFLQRVMNQVITLEEVYLYVINRKQSLYEIIESIGFEMDNQILINFEKGYSYYKDQLNKYRTYQGYMRKLETLVNLKDFNNHLLQLETDESTAPVSKLLAKGYWKYFEQFKTAEYFVKLQQSTLFNNIFQMCESKFQNVLKHQIIRLQDQQMQLIDDQIDEEEKDGLFAQMIPKPKLKQNQDKIEPLQFDEITFKEVIQRKCKAFFTQLVNYPQIDITCESLKLYWKGIKSSQIEQELYYALTTLEQINKSQDLKFNEQLKIDLQLYSQMDLYLNNSKVIKKSILFQTLEKANVIRLDPEYQGLKQFSKFSKSIKNETGLIEIRQNINKVKALIDGVENLEVDMKLLEMLVNTKVTYDFSIQHKGQNFNDLFERLDEHSFINTAIITDMNSISQTFNKINDQLLIKDKLTTIKFLALFLYLRMRDAQTEDNQFLAKLDNCHKNIHALKTLTRAELNIAENTLSIISDTLKKGALTWKISSEDQCQFSIQIAQQVIDNEKVNQHCSRAILMANSKKTDPEKEQTIKHEVSIFAEIVQISQDIRSLYRNLRVFGHFEFKVEDEFSIVCHPDIIEELRLKKLDLEKILDDWRNLLHDLRTEFYYLTFIPNQRLLDVIIYFENPNIQNLEKVYPIFKFIYKDIQIEEVSNVSDHFKDVYDIPIKLRILGQVTNKIFQNKNYQVPIEINSHVNFDQNLKYGRIKFKCVRNDFEQCKTILALYSATQYYPLASEIQFCSKTTALHEVENFILRAIDSPKYFNRKKLFVIANFQNLPLNVQMEAYKVMMILEQRNPKFLLVVICQSEDIKNENVIEDLKASETANDLLQLNKIIEIFKPWSTRVTTVQSDNCGLGKSEYIKDLIQQKNLNYQRIPIFGELNRAKITLLHQEKMTSQIENPGLHYDIYPTNGESLNIILFELLILNCINNGSQGIYHLPDNCPVFLEVANSLNEKMRLNQLLVGLFKPHKMQWSPQNIKIAPNGQDKYQIVSKFINAMTTNKYDQAILMNRETIMPIQDCQNIIGQYLITKIQVPNFYLLNAFIAFSFEQLNKLIDNPFFFQENLAEFGVNEGNLLFKSVVDNLIQLSLNLVNNEAVLSKQSMSLMHLNDEEAIVERFKNLKWENNTSFFIMINDSCTITPIYKELQQLPQALLNLQEKFGFIKNLKSFESMSQQEIQANIFEFVLKDQDKDLAYFRIMEREQIVFTIDNFLKLALIYIRIKANQPVIVMGETGVGKTAIISYLSAVMQANFKTRNIHAGITEEKIIKWVKKAQWQAEQELENTEQENKILQAQNLQLIEPKLTILFFDEINTNDNISGLLKEIVVDKHLQGEPLSSNIRVIAACNPYKLKGKDNNSVSTGIKHSHQRNNKASKLVYTVQPLPESMMQYIWDYGSLSPDEESQYIKQVIENQNQTFENDKYNDNDLKYIVNCVCKSQSYIRHKEAQWAVSLRDVARFSKLLGFFLQNNYSIDKQQQKNYIYRNDHIFNSKKRALVLALAFCYMYRINSTIERFDYKKMISNLPILNSYDLSLNEHQFSTILQEEQNRYIDKMQIPSGIGKNTPLKENVFVMITCILNKIPLILTGKPGSSKTLAMNLVAKSLKGQQSNEDFFRNFPAIVQFTYQGSVQSTSKGIEKIFDKAFKCQKGFEEEKDSSSKSLALVVFDEIGLAEISPFNSLKVLHSLLEPPKVPFIGISNWALDASKMNRAITLFRPDPCDDDLKESAISISVEISGNDQLKHNKFCYDLCDPLVRIYINYLNIQQKNLAIKNFHGLRDFYALIQYTCNRLSNFERENKQMIIQGLERNFSGQDIKQVINCAEKYLRGINKEEIKYQRSEDLIEANIQDLNARHLMVITDNFENSIQYIEDTCNEQQKEYQIFQGSDFQEDRSEEAAYKQINDIILCMERGIICVLLNLDSIYQSFYDMLNQNYQTIGSQRFCKVAIGPDSSRCLVNENFKCILVVDQDHVAKLDAPLLNRFEKQKMIKNSTLSSDDKMRIDDLMLWIASMSCIDPFKEEDMFPTLDPKDLAYLVTQNNFLSQDLQINICKMKIIHLANFSGIIRSFNSNQPDAGLYAKAYDQNGIHLCLQNLINVMNKETFEILRQTQQERSSLVDDNEIEMMQQLPKVQKWDSYFEYGHNYNFFSLNQDETKQFSGFNLMVHTYSPFMTELLQDNNDVNSFVLNSIYSKRIFELRIDEFLSNPQLKTLIVYADTIIDSRPRINLCRSIINNQRLKYHKKQCKNQAPKHVIFLIRQDENRFQSFSFALGWKQIFIEVLNGKGSTKHLSISRFLDSNFSEIIENPDTCQEIIDLVFIGAVSNLIFNQTEEWSKMRIIQIQKYIKNIDNFNFVFELLKKTIWKKFDYLLIDNNWQQKVAMDQNLIDANLSFHGASISFLSEIVQNHLQFLLYYLQVTGLITNKNLPRQLTQFAQEYFLTQFETTYANSELKAKYIVPEACLFTNFPFSQDINNLFKPLKEEYIEHLRSINSQIQEGEQDKVFQDVIERQIQIVKSVFPENIFQILSQFSKEYFEDFSFIINSTENDKNWHIYCMQILQLINTDKEYQNITQIYCVFWKYENMIQSIYDVLLNFNKLVNPAQILNELKRQLFTSFEEGHREILYFTKDEIISSLIKTLYKFLFPLKIKQICKNFTEFNPFLQVVAVQIQDLQVKYMGGDIVEETQKVEFIAKYYKEVFEGCLTEENDDSERTEFLTSIVKILETQDESTMSLIIKELNHQKQTLLADNLNLRAIRHTYKKFIYSTFEFALQEENQEDNVNEQFIGQMLNTALEDFEERKEGDQDGNYMPEQIKCIKSLVRIASEDEGKVFDDFETESSQWIDKSLVLSLINGKIKEQSLDYEHPFIVALADCIQMEVYEREQEDSDFNNLQKAINNIIDPNTEMLEKIRSLAFFKAQALKMSYDVSENINNENPIENEDIIRAINIVFDIETEKCLPLMIYIVKLLNQHLDLDIIREQVFPTLPWIKTLQFQDQEYQEFQIQYNQKLHDEMIDKLSLNEEKYVKELLNIENPENQVVETLVEFFYLNNKGRKDDYSKLIQISKLNQRTKTFMTTLLNDKKEGVQALAINLSDDLFIKKLQVIGSFLGSSLSSTSSKYFLSQLIEKPESIKDIYLPFQVNVKEDPQYYHILHTKDKNGGFVDGFGRWKCKNCQTIVIVIDCGELSTHMVPRAGVDYLKKNEAMRCQGCGLQVGSGGESNSERVSKKVPRALFSTDQEAKTGYIRIDSDNIDGIVIRQLTESQFRFGELLTLNTIMLAYIYGDNQIRNQICDIMFGNTQVNGYKLIIDKIVHAWDRIKELEGLTDEKIQKLLFYIISKFSENSKNEKFTFAQLSTIQGRKQFEQDFVQSCIPNSQGQFQQFFLDFGQNDKKDKGPNILMKHLNESISIQNESNDSIEKFYFSILRVQNPVNKIEMERYLKLGHNDSKLLSLFYEEHEILSKVKLLIPILEWVKYSMDRWSGRITIEDALELTAQQIFEKDEEKYQKDKDAFIKLEKATKILQDSGCSFRDGCDDIVFSTLTLQDKFQQCCITNTQKDSMGYKLFCIINFLADIQNNFLKQVQNLQGFEWVAEKLKHDVDIFHLAKEQLIVPNYKIMKEDFNYDNILEIVQSFSYSDLKYGQGKTNFYLFEDINQYLQTKLIDRKVFINYSKEISFQYSNIGSLAEQYAKISEKIPQEKYLGVHEIINNLRSNQEMIKMLEDLRITINFMSQTGGQANNKLSDYMQAFQIKELINVIGQGPMLRHVLHIYEEIEKRLIDLLIEKTNVKYKSQLSAINFDKLVNVCNSNNENLHILHSLSLLLGRFCVRHLTFESQMGDKQPLFDNLFDESFAYLFGIGSDNQKIEELQKTVENCSRLQIGESYQAYYFIMEHIQKIEIIQEQQRRQQEENRYIDEQNSMRQQQQDENPDNFKDVIQNSNLCASNHMLANRKVTTINKRKAGNKKGFKGKQQEVERDEF